MLFLYLYFYYLVFNKFYTYVNELSFSLDRNYLDESISIYLLWTSLLYFLQCLGSHLFQEDILFFYTY